MTVGAKIHGFNRDEVMAKFGDEINDSVTKRSSNIRKSMLNDDMLYGTARSKLKGKKQSSKKKIT